MRNGLFLRWTAVPSLTKPLSRFGYFWLSVTQGVYFDLQYVYKDGPCNITASNQGVKYSKEKWKGKANTKNTAFSAQEIKIGH